VSSGDGTEATHLLHTYPTSGTQCSSNTFLLLCLFYTKQATYPANRALSLVAIVFFHHCCSWKLNIMPFCNRPTFYSFHWMLHLFGLSTHWKMMYGAHNVNKETYSFMKMRSVLFEFLHDEGNTEIYKGNKRLFL